MITHNLLAHALFVAKRSDKVTPSQKLLLEALAYVIIDVGEGRIPEPTGSNSDALIDAIEDACYRNRSGNHAR